MKNNIKITVINNLCTSCGICKGICPKNCISLKFQNGMYIPSIDEDICIKCGLCADICPGIKREYATADRPIESIYGQYIKTYNAWSKNPKLRHVSASGGVISELVSCLLIHEYYDLVFCVDSYDYSTQLKSTPISTAEYLSDLVNSSYPKSRYLPVSHEIAVSYIKNFTDKRIIFIGTSCAITGLKRSAEKLHRDLSQYLFIGLFCDSVFNYNIMAYLNDHFSNGQKIKYLHFKNKESGGWPGNMKLILDNGSDIYLDKSERLIAKPFFMPECCLYCIDKLNINADISIGDNYTEQDSSILGSNSVIIRTEQGKKAWDLAKQNIKYFPFDIELLRKAQYLDDRLNNIYYGSLKERKIQQKFKMKVCLNEGIELKKRPIEYEQAWRHRLNLIYSGALYIKKPLLIKSKNGRLKNTFNRIYFGIRRRIIKE